MALRNVTHLVLLTFDTIAYICRNMSGGLCSFKTAPHSRVALVQMLWISPNQISAGVRANKQIS